jgi:hypothetical protein
MHSENERQMVGGRKSDFATSAVPKPQGFGPTRKVGTEDHRPSRRHPIEGVDFLCTHIT